MNETITIPQFRTLVILSNRGPVNLATLAGLLDVKPSAAGRMVDRLVGAGLIDRLPHPRSRRELLADLTDRGRQVVRQVTAHRRAEIARIVEKMPPPERRAWYARSLHSRRPAANPTSTRRRRRLPTLCRCVSSSPAPQNPRYPLYVG